MKQPPRLRYKVIRYGLRLLIACYLRVRVENAHLVPERENFLLCFNHPNWIDPMIIVAYWPDRRPIYIFGPREPDMRVGLRNTLIRWSRVGVPFKPSARDLIDTTKRAMAVLDRDILAVAGEGRLSEGEGQMAPLQEGPAYLALRAKVPIVPLAIIGTRWLRFGKRVRLRFGAPVLTEGRRSDRRSIGEVTGEVTAAFAELLEGVREEPPPGPFGRWLTDLYNERPWLEQEQAKNGADRSST